MSGDAPLLVRVPAGQPASWSIFAAMTKSLRVRPDAWVVSSKAARPQPSSMSG